MMSNKDIPCPVSAGEEFGLHFAEKPVKHGDYDPI